MKKAKASQEKTRTQFLMDEATKEFHRIAQCPQAMVSAYRDAIPNAQHGHLEISSPQGITVISWSPRREK